MNRSETHRIKSDGHEHISAATPLHGTRRFAVAAALVAGAAMLPATATNAADSDVARPIGGSCATTFAFTGEETVHLEGTCYLQHLGLTNLVATQSVTLQPDGSLLITNAAVYQAANGDTLNANFVGVGVFNSPTSATFSGNESYRGGTGRFANALGSVALRGSATFTSPTGGIGEFTTLGFIAY